MMRPSTDFHVRSRSLGANPREQARRRHGLQRGFLPFVSKPWSHLVGKNPVKRSLTAYSSIPVYKPSVTLRNEMPSTATGTACVHSLVNTLITTDEWRSVVGERG